MRADPKQEGLDAFLGTSPRCWGPPSPPRRAELCPGEQGRLQCAHGTWARGWVGDMRVTSSKAQPRASKTTSLPG